VAGGGTLEFGAGSQVDLAKTLLYNDSMAIEHYKNTVPNSTNTAIVLLGASDYLDDRFSNSTAFANSMDAVQNYFLSQSGFALDNRNQLLNLFDSEMEPTRIIEAIEGHLTAQIRKSPIMTDLIIWYIGHGEMDHIQNYCMLLKNSQSYKLGPTCLRFSDLTNVLIGYQGKHSRTFRTYFIIDACYSGQAIGEMAARDHFQKYLQDELPAKGFVAFCSSPGDSPSYFDPINQVTIFSNTLLSVLYSGIPYGNDKLSLSEVHLKVRQKYKEIDKQQPKHVFPVLGDKHDYKHQDMLSHRPLFPNRYVSGPTSNNIKMVCFDLDGTLLTGYQYSWSLIWKHLGFDDHVRKQMIRDYKKGKLKYKDWCDKCAEYFITGGLRRRHLHEIMKDYKVKPAKSYRRTMAFLDGRGIKRVIISGGVDTFLQKLPCRGRGFQHIFINKFIWRKDGRLDRIEHTDYDFKEKWDGLLKICEQESIQPHEVLFVGDSQNDEHIATKTPNVIAFDGTSDALSNIADWTSKTHDLDIVAQAILKSMGTQKLPLHKTLKERNAQ
jgi:HAD superfamily phosphoserine phosphatase-like hydrolase